MSTDTLRTRDGDMSEPRRPHCHGPARIDREGLHAKLMLFGTIVGMMEAHPETFGETEYMALQVLLYETAKEVWPEGQKEDT